MSELLFLLIPLIAIVSFALGYLFKGSFSTWLLKRRTKQSYLDSAPIVIKDDNPQASEVVEKLLNTVEYIVDGNLIANAPTLYKNVKVSKNKEVTSEINPNQDDIYEQINSEPKTEKENTAPAQEQEAASKISDLDQTLNASSINNPVVATLEQALQKAKVKAEVPEDAVLVARSLKDLHRPYSVLAEDVGHLLEMQMMAGVICMQRGDYMRAIKIFRHILAIPTWKNHGHTLAQMNLARCYLKAGMFSRALENLLPLVGNDQYELEVLELLLQLYLVTADWQPALAVAKGIYNLRKSESNLNQLCHYYIFRLLSCYLELGHRRTMFSFSRIIELSPTNVRTYVTRANYHFALGDYHSALEDYEHALKLRIDLLPSLISNIAFCFNHVRILGYDFPTFLRNLETPEHLQYMIDLYLDQVANNFAFADYAHSFEFQDQAKNSAEVFRELVLGQQTRDYEAELEQKIKTYQKTDLLDKVVSLIRDKDEAEHMELYERIDILLDSYAKNPQSITLQRIFFISAQLLTNTQVEVKVDITEKTNLLSSLFSLGRRKEAEKNSSIAQKQEKFSQFLSKIEQRNPESRIVASYSCRSCGYQHHDIFWLCPSCHKLDTFTLSKLNFSDL